MNTSRDWVVQHHSTVYVANNSWNMFDSPLPDKPVIFANAVLIPVYLNLLAATSKLAKQVATELKLEQKPTEDLAGGFTSFELKLDGALATLTRSHDQEEVKVQLNANDAIEAGGDEDEFDGAESEEEAGMDGESEVHDSSRLSQI